MDIDSLTILWVLLSFTGIVFAFVSSTDAFGHYLLVKNGWSDEEPLVEFVRTSLINEAARASVLLSFFIIGLNAAFGGPSHLFTGLMFYCNVVLVIDSVRAYRYRQRRVEREKNQVREKCERELQAESPN